MDSEEKKYTAKDLYAASIVGGIFQRSQSGTQTEAWEKAVGEGRNAAQNQAKVSDFEKRFDAAMKALDAEEGSAGVPVLHLGDTVEEIATRRLGKIDTIDNGAKGQEAPNYWRVRFTDGKRPAHQILKSETELRLVSCPHDECNQPKFRPKRSIMPKL